MDKFTLFELHVHDGMEFSATNTAPAIGRSADEDDEEYAELADVVDDETEEDANAGTDESSGRSVGPAALLLGVVALAVVAIALRKFRGSDADLEIADLDDFSEAPDEEEAEI
jgi:hypothetical protein